jgi:DNA-binding NarL/FixJ family response regulator
MCACEAVSECGADVVGAFPARILLVDDHPLIRQAIRETLAQERDLAVCGEAGDEAAAMQLVRSMNPHLVLLDLSLGDTSGLDLIRWMVKTAPAIRVLVLSMHDENLYAARVVAAGARGYVNKRETPDTIVAAIREVLAGRIYVNPMLRDRIRQRPDGGGSESAPA